LLSIHYNGIIWANKQGEKMTFMIRKRLLPRRRGDSRHYAYRIQQKQSGERRRFPTPRKQYGHRLLKSKASLS
jgi:hypothetical protein